MADNVHFLLQPHNNGFKKKIKKFVGDWKNWWKMNGKNSWYEAIIKKKLLVKKNSQIFDDI
jgi:hypothetical protein